MDHMSKREELQFEIKNITPKELAEEFCNMFSSQQAEFFENVCEYMHAWGMSQFEFQVDGIVEEIEKNKYLGAIKFLDAINTFLKDYKLVDRLE